MSTPPSDLPPPPPDQPAANAPTHIAGQETAPVSSVPAAPPGQMYNPTPAGASSQTNSLAVISLVAGIGSFFAHIIPGVGGFTVALVAIVTGYMARNQIKQTGEQGMAMATAGMIIGIVHIVLIGLAIILLLFLIFVVGIAIFGIRAHSPSG